MAWALIGVGFLLNGEKVILSIDFLEDNDKNRVFSIVFLSFGVINWRVHLLL